MLHVCVLDACSWTAGAQQQIWTTSGALLWRSGDLGRTAEAALLKPSGKWSCMVPRYRSHLVHFRVASCCQTLPPAQFSSCSLGFQAILACSGCLGLPDAPCSPPPTSPPSLPSPMPNITFYSKSTGPARHNQVSSASFTISCCLQLL